MRIFGAESRKYDACGIGFAVPSVSRKCRSSVAGETPRCQRCSSITRPSAKTRILSALPTFLVSEMTRSCRWPLPWLDLRINPGRRYLEPAIGFKFIWIGLKQRSAANRLTQIPPPERTCVPAQGRSGYLSVARPSSAGKKEQIASSRIKNTNRENIMSSNRTMTASSSDLLESART